jgi:DNA-binding HxlR family transcriptional regulator
MHNTKTIVQDQDKFDPLTFSPVAEEIRELMATLENISSIYKLDIFISYLKSHSIRTEWVTANPEMAALMLSRKLRTTNLEAFFISCQSNKRLSEDLEEYIKQKLR